MATQLTTALALCAPTGMNPDDRTEWLKAARMTVGHLPADLLTAACRHVRETCDHPAKIVPAIIAFAEAEYAERERALRIANAQASRRPAEPEPPAWNPDECREMAEKVEALIRRLPSA